MSETSHIHTDVIIVDSDVHFTIDTNTRVISNRNADKVNEKLVLTQYDNKSERYSFDIDRHVESHDLFSCNRVQIHYINIGSNNQKNVGVYLVDDVHINESDDNKISFSWLVTQNATMLDGVLSFLVSFECVNGETVLYRWSTTTYDAIQIVVGLDNGGAVIEQCADELLAWQIKMENEYLPSLVDDCYLDRNFATSEEVAGIFNMYSSDEVLSIIGIDDDPTDNSMNLVRSGGVKTYVDDIKQSYLKSASVSDDVLTITKQDGSSIRFKGGSGSGNTGSGNTGSDDSKANVDATNLTDENKKSWITALGVDSKADQSDLNELNSTAERLDNDIEELNNSISSLNTNKANLDATNLSAENKNSWITALGVDLKANNDEVNSLLDNKVDKVSDKGLSTNDLTNELLQEIQDGLVKELESPIDVYNTPDGIYRIPANSDILHISGETIPNEGYILISNTEEDKKFFTVFYNTHNSGELVQQYMGFGEIFKSGYGHYYVTNLSALTGYVDTSTDQTINGLKTFGQAPKLYGSLSEKLDDKSLVSAEWVNDKLDKKQDTLTAGNNITINEGIISAELSGSAPIILLDTEVRIWNLDSGIYKVPEGASIYYYGETGGLTIPYFNSSSAILIVNNMAKDGDTTLPYPYKKYILFASIMEGQQKSGFVTGKVLKDTGSYWFFDTETDYLPISGGALTGSLQVKKVTDWGQVQLYSSGNVYHALEVNDNLIRLDCRNFNGAGTDNRRILDLCCSRYKTNPVDGLGIWTAYTSLLKTGSVIKSGSKLNGTDYSTDTTLNADLNITASSTLKTGSTVKANSIVNGNKYTADTVTTADITLTRNTGTTNKVITDAGGTISGTLTVSNAIRRKNNSVEYNKAPSSTDKVYIGFTDKNNNDYAVIDCQKDVSGNTKLIINPRSINGTWASTNGTFSVNIDSSGKVTTKAVTPASTADDTQIATTAWVKDRTDTFLPLTGGTVTGTTVFSKTTDAGETTDNDVAVIIGNREGQHIAIDGNEILSKSGPTKGGELWLNDTASVYLANVAKAEPSSNSFRPQSDNAKSLGSTSYRWKDGHFSGNVYDVSSGKYCTAKSNNPVTYPYHRIAYVNPVSSNYYDAHIVLLISKGYNGGGYGILDLTFRTDRLIPTSSTALAQNPTVSARWLALYNLNAGDVTFNINYDNSTSNTYGTIYKNVSCDVFYKLSGTYNGIVIKELLSDYRGTADRRWTLVNSYDTSSTNYSECWETQAEASTALRGSSAKSTGNSVLSGNVNNATWATNANTASTTEKSTKIATTEWVSKADAMVTGASSPVQNQHDTVVKYWMNSDGTEWYRIWASGFKEWGMLKSNSSNTDDVSITFTNFSFSSTNYIIQANMRGSKGSGGTADTTLVCRASGLVHTQTTTGFKFQALARNYMLYACGI